VRSIHRVTSKSPGEWNAQPDFQYMWTIHSI
jgi:hypothetical protein